MIIIIIIIIIINNNVRSPVLVNETDTSLSKISAQKPSEIYFPQRRSCASEHTTYSVY